MEFNWMQMWGAMSPLAKGVAVALLIMGLLSLAIFIERGLMLYRHRRSSKEFIKKGHNVKLIYFPLDWNKQGSLKVTKGIITIPFSRRHGPYVLISNILKLYKLAGWCDIIHFQKCFFRSSITFLPHTFIDSCGRFR